MYTVSEYCDMHFMYGAAFGNSLQARRLYQQHYPDRQCPSHVTFSAVHNRLRETGTFKINMNDTGSNRDVRTVDYEEDILRRFEENPRTSTRAVANETNSSHFSVWKVLKENNMHPYSIQKVQTLSPDDYPRRVNSSRWFLHKIVETPNFLQKVIFTDESTFNRDGVFNSRNSHCWAYENPHSTVMRRSQTRFSVNVWVGLLNNRIIGPYILPNRLNSPTYLVFLRDILPVLLENVPLADRMDMWFQHDGCPSHFGNNVTDFLNATYRQKWIGRGGPVPWPPRSPDLTPIDFFIWGRMKDLVYSTPVDNEIELVARIAEASAILQEENDDFAHVRESMTRRFTLCNERAGQHFEQFL